MDERMMPGTAGWELYYLEHSQRYLFAAAYCQGRRVVDLACGVGFGSQILAQQGAALVCGVDLSHAAVAHARDYFAHPAVHYLVADGLRADTFQLPFDVAVSFETIEHVSDPERFVATLYDMLTADGMFICSAPNIERHSGAGVDNPYHLSEMPLDELRRLIGRYFVIEQVLHQSETPAYRRQLDSYIAFQRLANDLRRSRLLMFEAQLRRIVGGGPLFEPLPISIAVPAAGDFVLEPLEQQAAWQKTYLLVGRRRG